MEHLTGLEWSAGLFGFAIGMIVGTIMTWLAMRGQMNVGDDPLISVDDSPKMQPQLSATQVTIAYEAPHGDVPAIPVAHGNLILMRIYQRWLDAQARGDRFAMNRQEGRMLCSDIEPPTSREEAERELAKLKGEAL